jgi:Pro-kumamolisin, activation domain/Bacterial Ig-like domain (group 3)
MLKIAPPRSLLLPLLLMLLFAPASNPQSQPRITAPIEDSSRIALPESHPKFLSRAKDLGTLNDDRTLDRMVLTLKPSPDQQHELTRLLDSQQTKGSQSYHAWLTPAEFGQRFGPAPEDLAKTSEWLQQQGFRVDSVAKSGMWMVFSGTVAQVNAAFRTQMHRYQIDGESHIANATDISIPAALTTVVAGVPLHDFFSKPTLAHFHAHDSPAITASWNGAHAIVPADFAAIYDLSSLYKTGLNGSGQTIAITGEADITPSDIASFQQIFGLPANLPNIIENGADPGVDTQQGYGEEATIDTEWASAIAPGAAIDLVVSAPTETTDGVALSAMYILDQDLAQIMSVSYGECEQNLGPAANTLWNSLWEQAAAQGMSVFVASGDSGSVACNAQGGANPDPAGYGPMAVSGLASTPFNTAVGGTEFDEGVNGGSASTFWNAANGTNLVSVTGYIPEMVWNDSCDDGNAPYWEELCSSNLPTLSATGGGVSTVYATPPWQTLNVTGLQALAGYNLPNQPGVAPRGIPDVALPASAAHDGYLYCFTTNASAPDCQLVSGALAQSTFQNEAGGTSFGAPAFAGIMAIVNQQEKSANPSPSPSPIADGRQGLANYTLYALAASETYSGCNSSNRTNPSQAASAGCTFNDITTGNNGPPESHSAPGVSGYSAAAGYDLVSGLGSVDARNLVASWTSAGASFHGSETTLTANAGTGGISIQHGQLVSFAVTVQKLSGDSTSQIPAGSVSLIAQGGTLPGSVGLQGATLASGTGDSAVTGNLIVGNLPAGSYNVIARYPGNGYFAASTSNSIPVTVTPESSNTTLNVYTYSNGYGSPVQFVVQVSGASGQGFPSGTITLADGGNAFAKVPLSNDGEAVFNTCPGTAAGFFPSWSTMPCFSAGTHQFSATYSGDLSFNPSPTPPATSQSVTINIPKGEVPLLDQGFTSQSNSGAINAPITVTAALPTSPDAAAATGTVQFFLNSTALGPPAPLSGNPAQASLPNVTLPQGQYTITTNYSGDSNYNPLSTVQSWTSGVPLGWIATTTATTVNPGQTATFNLTLSNATYIGQTPITCIAGTNPNQPATPPVGVQCSLSLSSVNLTSTSQTASVVVTITTTTQSLLSPAPFRTLPFTLPPVLAFVLWGTRRRRWRTLMGYAGAALVISCVTSCGGGSGTKSTGPSAPPATSALFTVLAETTTAVGSGVTDTGYTGVTLTVNINQ